MPIDKNQLIPFLKGIAEGYEDQPGRKWESFHVANLITSIFERIESGEFDEVCEYCNNTGMVDRGGHWKEQCYDCDSWQKNRGDDE